MAPRPRWLAHSLLWAGLLRLASPLCGDDIEPEYDGRLDRVFFVYEQVDSPYQFSEIAAICGHLPPGAEVIVICAPGSIDDASRRLEEHGIEARLAVAPDDPSWHWGRDVGQLAWPRGERTLLVPWNKTAGLEGDLIHNARTLHSMRPLGVRLEQAPLSFEGGNCIVDRFAGQSLLLAGHSAILDTIALHAEWVGERLSFDGAVEVFRRTFGVDRVVPVGRWRGKTPLRQAAHVFHLDMAAAVVAPGVAVVAALEASSATYEAVREEVRLEVEAVLGDRDGRAAMEAAVKRHDSAFKVPGTAAEPALYIDEVASSELDAIHEAEEEFAAVEGVFRSLGYKVHILETNWRSARKYQAPTNVIASCDRLILPIFPERESVFAFTLPLRNGRRVAILRSRPGPHHYRLSGVNLRAHELYLKLFPGDVRVVPDVFYLTGGNVHCVLGRL